MIRLLAILTMSLLTCNAGQAKSTFDEVHLRATVQDVVLLTHFSGKIILVDVDPRFALTVRVEAVVPSVANFAPGTVVVLAIHSPSLLFGEDPTKGKTYDFSLQRRIKRGKARFFGLRLSKVQAAPVTSLPE